MKYANNVRQYLEYTVAEEDLIKTISFPANCFVLAIDAPLPDGDKTELTKKLVSLVTITQITLENYKLQITSL